MSGNIFREVQQGVMHLFYPQLCEGCSKPLLKGERVLCISCGLELPVTNYPDIEDNEMASRFAGRVPFVYALSYAYFTNEGLLQHLLHGLKYKNKKETGYYLGRKLGQSLQNGLTRKEGSLLPDMIVPVPLHKNKIAKRGYNQSEYIAEGISEILGVPTVSDLLLRRRDTESQTHKTRTERIENMTEAFAIKKGAQLTGKHILLCDDVLTTGATLEACARAFIADKSIKISLVTVGIAVS